MSLYQNEHRCQYDYSPNTASNGCTWTSGANGADAATGGRRSFTPDYVEKQVDTDEQTNPSTPGWSMGDLELAMRRLDVPFIDETGGTFDDAMAAVDDGLYIVLQGDSDQFGNHTCSGAFNGDHAIGVHPQRNSVGDQRIDDPICQESRYEKRSTLRKYAEDLARSIGEYPGIRYGVFVEPVPDSDDTTGGGEEDMPGTPFVITGQPIGMATVSKPIGLIPTQGGAFYEVEPGYQRHVYNLARIGAGKYAGSDAYLVLIPGTPDDTGLLLASAASYTPYAQGDTREYEVKVIVGGDEVTGKVTLP